MSNDAVVQAMRPATAPFPAQGSRSRRRLALGPGLRTALGLLGVLIAILLMEVIPRLGLVDPRFLPPFSTIVADLIERMATPAFWTALSQTVSTWVIGLAIAVAGGAAAGIVIGSLPLVREATASTVEFLRPIPSVALIPLAVLLFGTSVESTLLLVIYASFWPVLLQVISGVADVDALARDTAAVYRFRPLTRLRRLIWPTVLPFAVTGFRLAASIALVLTVTGELIIGTPGIGQSIAVTRTAGDVPGMFGLVMVTGILGLLVNLLTRLWERRLLRWHPSVRWEATS